MTSPGFEHVFPVIRGVQAGREYYVSMCPLRLLPKLFLFNEAELVPELRAQRQLNRARVPEMSRYVTENTKDYIFSAITVSVDAEVNFEQFAVQGVVSSIGLLHIPMSARFVINDGQHRRAAIEMALRERPELGDESIAVVFFLDLGLERCQQMFADLNRYAIRPSKSLGVLYDYRDDTAQLTKNVVIDSPLFRDLVEMEKTALSKRSRRLFTLSAIYAATSDLLKDIDIEEMDERTTLVASFWQEVAKQFNDWELVRKGKLTAGRVRSDSIHTHSVVLQALARIGNTLLRNYPNDWKRRLCPLQKIDWRRTNASLWEGRTMLGGRVSKSQQNIVLTVNAIKKVLSLELSPEEQRVENAFQRGQNETGNQRQETVGIR